MRRVDLDLVRVLCAHLVKRDLGLVQVMRVLHGSEADRDTGRVAGGQERSASTGQYLDRARDRIGWYGLDGVRADSNDVGRECAGSRLPAKSEAARCQLGCLTDIMPGPRPVSRT